MCHAYKSKSVTEMADSVGGVDSKHPAAKSVPVGEYRVVPTMQSRTLESSRRNTVC